VSKQVRQRSGPGPKRFAFLGASGRIGRLLRAVWGDENASDLRIDPQLPNPKTVFPNGFVWSDMAMLDPFLDHTNAVGGLDGVFVFVGATGHGDPAQMALNVSLVEHAMQAAAAAKIPRVIVASSAAVYGGGTGRPFRESDTLAPVNGYGAAKQDMEKRCSARAHALGIEVCILRIGNVAGADALLGNAVNWRSGDAPVQLDIYPDGTGPRRSYIGPKDLASVLKGLALCPAPLAPVINIAAPDAVAMDALLDAAGIDWLPRKVAASPLQNIVLDCVLLETLSFLEATASAPAQIVAQWRRAVGAT
jgi:UDP-glucose 4-epimerase